MNERRKINAFISVMVTTSETPAAIIAFHKNGLSCAEIAAKNIAPRRTVFRIVKEFKETGKTAPKRARGRPRIPNSHQDRHLVRSQLSDRAATSSQLGQEWRQVGVKASDRTVRRRFLSNGLKSRRPAKKPFSIR